MQRKSGDVEYRISFADVTPQLFVGYSKSDPLYEKAYLSSEADTDNEFKRNTTTWD